MRRVSEIDQPDCVEILSNRNNHNKTPYLSISQRKEELFLTK